MKAGTKLAHPSQCREVGPGDLDRLLAAGWVEIKKPVNANARKQRQFRRRCKELGYRRFAVYLPEAAFEELKKAKKPYETMSELLVRLLRESNENDLVGEDK